MILAQPILIAVLAPLVILYLARLRRHIGAPEFRYPPTLTRTPNADSNSNESSSKKELTSHG